MSKFDTLGWRKGKGLEIGCTSVETRGWDVLATDGKGAWYHAYGIDRGPDEDYLGPFRTRKAAGKAWRKSYGY